MICLVDVFFFNDTATTEIYTLSLHDALPISHRDAGAREVEHLLLDPLAVLAFPDHPELALAGHLEVGRLVLEIGRAHVLNSSHANISYAVFCLKKKKNITLIRQKFLHKTNAE